MNQTFRFFEADQCISCGTCLDLCRYIPIFGKEAARARDQIRSKQPVSEVLERCTSCFACDTFCPNGLHPYESILEFWNDRYEATGLPQRARFLMPGSDPNFRSYVTSRMAEDEKEVIQKWTDSKETMTGTVVYPGCNLITLPHLAGGKVFDGITIHGDFDLCCGEMYFRMGLFSEVEKIAEKLTRFYAEHEIEEMLFVCPACYNMFTNVLPDKFGAKFSFRTRFFTDLLLEKMEDGSWTPEKLAPRKTVVHDSCHARILGEEFLSRQRKLLSLLGLEPVDPVENLMQGHCCGIAAGCANQSPIAIAKTALSALEEYRKTSASEVATYCTGCHLVLTMIGMFHPLAPPVRHLLDYVNETENPGAAKQAVSRSKTALAGIVRHAFPDILSTRRFRITH